MLDIRTYTWLNDNTNLSWVYVMKELVKAFDQLGHNTNILSTNGLNETTFPKEKMIKSISELQKFGSGKKAIDIDFTYTVPQNFPERFLPNSKAKCAIYNYETTIWPREWRRFYGLVDYYLPSSNFSAEVFYMNGIPKEKIFVIPHGVDTSLFNPSIPAIKLKTNKKFKFISVVAPHMRKNIDLLLEAYCEAFTASDDVCLVLKTKLFKHSDGEYNAQKNPKGRKGFEIVVGDIFRRLVEKYGKNMPEIELLLGQVENVASIYNACQCHITTTGAEGYGLPILESMGSGLINICPNYSGQLDFANTDNSLLIDTKLRSAKQFEQYWGYNPQSQIGQPSKKHTIELMQKAVKEYDMLMARFKPNMEKTVKELSWQNAAQKIIDATQGKIAHYKPGTYNWWPK